MTPRLRVAALLALAAGTDAAWTVGYPHTAAAAPPCLLLSSICRLLFRACSAWSSPPTAPRRPRACTARPASSRVSACATAGELAPLAPGRHCPAPAPEPEGSSPVHQRPFHDRHVYTLLSPQDKTRGPRPVRLQAEVWQPLDQLVGPLVQERGGGQGVGVPLKDVRDRHRSTPKWPVSQPPMRQLSAPEAIPLCSGPGSEPERRASAAWMPKRGYGALSCACQPSSPRHG